MHAIAAASWLIGDRLALPGPALLLAIAFLVGTGLGFYHVGVEQHWFAGPSACTGAPITGGNIADLKAQLLARPPVRCDEVAWSLVGVSLAGWNLLASLGLAAAAAAGMRLLTGRRAMS